MAWDHIPAEEARMMHGVWAMEDARERAIECFPKNLKACASGVDVTKVSLSTKEAERVARKLSAVADRMDARRKAKSITITSADIGSRFVTEATSGSFDAGNV